MVQHLFRIILISEGYIPEFNLSFYLIYGYRIRSVRNIRRDRQDFKESLKSRVSILELLCEGYQFLHRICKVVDVEKEGDQVCQFYRICQHHPHSCQKNYHRDQRAHGSQSGIIDAHIFVADLLGCHKIVISCLELLHLFLFVGKRLYYPDTCQAVFYLAVDICNLFPVPLKSAFHLPVVVEGK